MNFNPESGMTKEDFDDFALEVDEYLTEEEINYIVIIQFLFIIYCLFYKVCKHGFKEEKSAFLRRY